MLKALILAGGNGTRLWPRSTSRCPKQFVPFFHGESMFQQTVKRLREWIPMQHIHVVTLEEYVPYVREQSDLSLENIIVEPEAKDTAACIGLGAVWFEQKNEDPVLLTIPSDHYISGNQAFSEAVLKASRQAAKSRAW